MLYIHELVPNLDPRTNGTIEKLTVPIKIEKLHFHGKTDRSDDVTIWEGADLDVGVMLTVGGVGQYVQGDTEEIFNGMTAFYKPLAKNGDKILIIGSASGELAHQLNRRAGDISEILVVEWDQMLSGELRKAIKAPPHDRNVTIIYDDIFRHLPNPAGFIPPVFDAVFIDLEPQDPRTDALMVASCVWAKAGGLVTMGADHETWPMNATAQSWPLRYTDAQGWRYVGIRV